MNVHISLHPKKATITHPKWGKNSTNAQKNATESGGGRQRKEHGKTGQTERQCERVEEGDKQRNGIMKGGMGRSTNSMNEKRNRMNAETKWDERRNGANQERDEQTEDWEKLRNGMNG